MTVNKKDKIVKVSLITILVIVLCLICFFASSSNSSKYSESSTNSSEATDSNNETLEEITKESGKVSDDERVSPDEITVNDYLDLYKSSETAIVLISRPTCQYCKIATPIIENIIYETGIKINYINVENMSEEDKENFSSSDSYFSEGFGTPLVLAIGNNSIIDKVDGLTTKSNYKSFFQKYESKD